jgi:uracil-DNA glycosylase family 4
MVLTNARLLLIIIVVGKMNKAKELEKIAAEIRKCPHCRRWGKGAPVPGEGNPDAAIVLVGEAPGREEAVTGRPFVGRSGMFLRSVIKQAGLQLEEVYITSPVKYLPLGGTPLRENILHGSTHLLKQLSAIDPEIIVLMGSTACIALLNRRASITGEHGSVVRKEGRTYFITFHPAYAMRFPEGKKAFVADLRKLKRLTGRAGGNERR